VKENDFKRICKIIDSEECVAFLGAGACTAFTNHEGKIIRGLPTGWDLAKKITEKCWSLNGRKIIKKCPTIDGKECEIILDKDYDLMTAAEHYIYECSGKRKELEELITNEIDIPCGPRPIHTALAQLNSIKFIITTNYDTLMETALDTYLRRKTLHIHRRSSSRQANLVYKHNMNEKEVVLHKMHGTISEPDTFIITKSDYVSYIASLYKEDSGMPGLLRREVLPQYNLLFLGYGLEDWDFQVIWKGVLSNRDTNNQELVSYALVKPTTEENRNYVQAEYWRNQHVNVIEKDLTDFAEQLAAHYNLEIPELNIKKQEAGGGS